jgi:hypothetical protein
VSAAAAAGPLDVARARRLTAQLREALTLAVELLEQAYDGQAWRALGYGSWVDYCAAELPQLAQLRIPVEERRSAVAELRGRGWSVRAIAAPLGLSAGTVHSDLKATGTTLATVTSLDGRQRPASAGERPAAPRLSNVARAALIVREAGPGGITVRALCARTRWHHGQASATLTRLAQSGAITYRRPPKRGQMGVYVIAP